MIGAIVGDIIGSVYEFMRIKDTDFPLFSEYTTFTDDTVLSVAIADSILSGEAYVDKLHEYSLAYPNRIYGASFLLWVKSSDKKPYNSWGNGSAMRVSSVGFAYNDLDIVLEEAKRSAEVTHNHPEGIKGAQATAAAIFMGRTGSSKNHIRSVIQSNFSYDLDRTIAEIRPEYEFNESCQGTVPEAIIAFLDSDDYESAIRLAISLGGDADTLACITGGIAEAYYGGVPDSIASKALAKLDDHLRTVVDKFYRKYGLHTN